MQCCLLLEFAVTQWLLILLQCSAVNIMFLVTIFKGGAGNAFLQLRDMPHTKQTHCLLHIEVELM